MKRITLALFAASLALLQGANPLLAADRSDEQLIEEATSPLPVHLRAEASVVMNNSKGTERVLRKGSNGFACYPDEHSPNFRVVCREASWKRYIGKIGPILAQTSTSPSERLALIDATIDEGSVTPPTPGSRAYSLSGPDRERVKPLFVISLPGATAESTGLPTERSNGTWLMCPGTPTAHIMVGDIPYGQDEDMWKSCGR